MNPEKMINGPACRPEDLLSVLPDLPAPTGKLVDFEELDWSIEDDH